MNEAANGGVKSKERSVLVPFLIGGIIGAAVGLLLAPKSGRETRTQIKDLAADTRDKIASSVERGKAIYEDAKTAIRSGVDAGKEAYAQERDKVITTQ